MLNTNQMCRSLIKLPRCSGVLLSIKRQTSSAVGIDMLAPALLTVMEETALAYVVLIDSIDHNTHQIHAFSNNVYLIYIAP